MINHIAIKIFDLEKCCRFYSEVLDLLLSDKKYDEQGELRSIWFDLKPGLLMLEKTSVSIPHPSNHSGWYLLALEISVVKRLEWKEKLLKAGVPLSSESLYSLYFSDPEGNKVALSHYPENY